MSCGEGFKSNVLAMISMKCLLGIQWETVSRQLNNSGTSYRNRKKNRMYS